jgi:GH15 family glucan-1,4-alpha-glucosidase
VPDAPWARVLREYALLADGERGALLGPHGEIVWMCAPRWDSDAVFTTLLGGEGNYVVTPVDPTYVWGGYYEEDSLIWRTRWVTSEGAVECREALALPADDHRLVLLRRIEALDRQANVRLVLNPRAEFGRKKLRSLRRTDERVWTGRTGDLHVRWSGAPRVQESDKGLETEVSVPSGDHLDLVLEVSDQPLPEHPVDPDTAWEATRTAWRARVPRLGPVVGERDARHAYTVLSGLTSTSGGMVAAATTSLPERADAGRNYDYRFCWIRDQCYAGRAVAADGAHPLLDDALRFVTERVLEDGPGLRPAYTNRGGRVPAEREVGHLIGYPGGGNTIGNKIDGQFQLDAFGEALLLLGAGARHDRLDSHHWHAVEVLVESIRKRGGEPDAGIWELADRRWAHSRLICAAGLRAVAASAPASQASTWASLADELVASASEDCLHPTGRWQRAPDDERVDAALLLPAIRGGVAPDDPRSQATLDAVLADLVQDDFVYRFRHDARPLEDAEGAFLLCGFFAALAMHQAGEPVTARAFYERSRAGCGPPGLFSEEYDVRQRQLRGNLPQAFVHALMLEASVRLARPWSDEHDRPEE